MSTVVQLDMFFGLYWDFSRDVTLTTIGMRGSAETVKGQFY